MSVFNLSQEERDRVLLPELEAVTAHHRTACPPYARVLDALGHRPGASGVSVADLPWLPIGLLRERELTSLAPGRVVRTLTSSGTSGRSTRVALDAAAATASAMPPSAHCSRRPVRAAFPC
ncbi:hypothetical protein [Streptomyces sp. BE230]|uniref:hypothetical protein n=1 Tax=Streptomyces sp. BE230 TaxID=3002526 RepID=UPI002ED054EF|nr:hypothetical protein [Streptomyces sp. BE230]